MSKTLDMIGSLSSDALRRVITKLSPTERDTLWSTIVDEIGADATPPKDPRERLRWHVENEQRDRLKAWMTTADVWQLGAAYLRIVSGDGYAAIFEDLSPAPRALRPSAPRGGRGRSRVGVDGLEIRASCIGND